jgi:hypothetical protein
MRESSAGVVDGDFDENNDNFYVLTLSSKGQQPLDGSSLKLQAGVTFGN